MCILYFSLVVGEYIYINNNNNKDIDIRLKIEDKDIYYLLTVSKINTLLYSK